MNDKCKKYFSEFLNGKISKEVDEHVSVCQDCLNLIEFDKFLKKNKDIQYAPPKELDHFVRTYAVSKISHKNKIRFPALAYITLTATAACIAIILTIFIWRYYEKQTESTKKLISQDINISHQIKPYDTSGSSDWNDIDFEEEIIAVNDDLDMFSDSFNLSRAMKNEDPFLDQESDNLIEISDLLT